jgi:hypothetical protein
VAQGIVRDLNSDGERRAKLPLGVTFGPLAAPPGWSAAEGIADGIEAEADIAA